VLVPTEDGKGLDQWGIEIGAPAINVKMGWRKDSVVATRSPSTLRRLATAGNSEPRFLTFEDGRRLDGARQKSKQRGLRGNPQQDPRRTMPAAGGRDAPAARDGPAFGQGIAALSVWMPEKYSEQR
jgi:hypothetical protein